MARAAPVAARCHPTIPSLLFINVCEPRDAGSRPTPNAGLFKVLGFLYPLVLSLPKDGLRESARWFDRLTTNGFSTTLRRPCREWICGRIILFSDAILLF